MSEAGVTRSKGAGGIIFVAGLLSLALIGLLVFLLYHSVPCKGTGTENGFIATWVKCRQSNEIGDLLAGAFAPLAFIWLAAAVVIQSTELRYQREELALNRREAEETRKAIQAQAEEARKQAEFIGIQTAILQASERRHKDHEVVREFHIVLDSAAASIKRMDSYNRVIVVSLDTPPPNAMSVQLFDKLPNPLLPTRDFLSDLCRNMMQGENRLSGYLSDENRISRPVKQAEWDQMRSVLTDAANYLAALPPLAQTEVRHFGLDVLKILVDKICSRFAPPE